jgi:4-amino-4-deoxy-L-arabinose transferase-like glycosyltransferase
MVTPSEPMPEKNPGRPFQETQEIIKQVGESRVHIRVDAPPGTRVRIIVESQAAHDPVPAHETITVNTTAVIKGTRTVLAEKVRQFFQSAAKKAGAVQLRLNWEALLFILAVVIYLVVRVVRLPDFPIYFFTDEAVQTVLAQDFLRDGLRGYDKEFLPTYFQNGYQYNLGVSVYAQVLPYMIFGKSVWVTRGVSVLISIIAAVSVGLILKQVFKKPYAWTAILLLSLTPAWFLHSRTAFETALATSFFAAFLYFYLRYRTASPYYLYPAVIMGALTFYSYAPIRMVVGFTALLLFFSDIVFHWRNRRTVIKAFLLTLLMTVPLLRFQHVHPDETINHLIILSSYWIQPISMQEKLGMFFTEYLHGLNPLYWYLPNTHDLPRHLMKDYGHLSAITFPLAVGGIAICIRNFRSGIHRALLIALLAAPSGAALAELGITRALVMVIPLALLSALGLSTLLDWLVLKWRTPRTALLVPVFLIMSYYNVSMLQDALVNGPVWFKNYGLAGMQYGANQLFPAIDAYLQEKPESTFIVTPSWANGTDTVARFYYPGDIPFKMGNIDGYTIERRPISEKTIFVMTPEEYDRAETSNKFRDIDVVHTIPYPNGLPGFYFIRLDYVENIEEILAEEIEQRKQLITDALKIDNQWVQVAYSKLDMGTIDKLFDGDENSLVRTQEANPLRLQLDFEQPRAIQGVSIKVGGTPTRIGIVLQDDQGAVLFEIEKDVEQQAIPRFAELDWGKVVDAQRVSISITSLDVGEPAHVHLWEVILK